MVMSEMLMSKTLMSETLMSETLMSETLMSKTLMSETPVLAMLMLKTLFIELCVFFKAIGGWRNKPLTMSLLGALHVYSSLMRLMNLYNWSILCSEAKVTPLLHTRSLQQR